MDNRPTSPNTQEKGVNTVFHIENGPARSLARHNSEGGLSNEPLVNSVHKTVTLVVVKDDKGYGMKVSGDNPVYVQSVKEGGAAEKAGLHSGDKIIKVNGNNVTHSTHTEVVQLIRSSVQVQLTVQHRLHSQSGRCTPHCPPQAQVQLTQDRPPIVSSASMPSPIFTPPNVTRPPTRDRITAPQPVDHEKLRQLESERVKTFKLMLEKEQRYVEALRSELAKCTDSSNEQQISRDLKGAERRVRTLQEQLFSIVSTSNGISNGGSASPDLQHFISGSGSPPPVPPLSTLPSRHSHTSSIEDNDISLSSPPPLPSRNTPITSPVINWPPPPLPPRQYLHNPSASMDDSQECCSTSTSVVDDTSPSSPLAARHFRTISSPEHPVTSPSSLSEALTKRLIAAESMYNLSSVKRSRGGVAWNVDSPTTDTPPGTPPPPYRDDIAVNEHNTPPEESSPLPAVTSDEEVKCDTSGVADCNLQNTIISMEDEESDQDVCQLEDHGAFKSLSRLRQHNAHLAVFLNYVISNSDPSSLLFYLVTDLYKEGNGKEMKKWAYEIHSSFLVPGAPLRLNNVDENIAREIDDTLLHESDREEYLRKVFFKARVKAKEELNEQLVDFQQKRTAGLGTLFGPPDGQLDESVHDKGKEMKIVESVLLPKMEPFIEDIEREVVDNRRFTTAAALGTILSKVFGLRGAHFSSLLERCPTFVSKEKSFKARLIGKSRKVTTKGHQLVAHQYFTVTYCNHCQLIIWGVGPQGFQCTNCQLNIHRPCVKVLEENCPGPLLKKEKANDRISKLMERIRPEREARRKPFSQVEKSKRQGDDKEDASATDNETGEKTSGSKLSKADTVKETEERLSNSNSNNVPSEVESDRHFLHAEIKHHSDRRNTSTSINRSESYKERIHSKKQLRERRKTSDPNLSKTHGDVDVETTAHLVPYVATNSASSSTSNLSCRSLDSPNQSLEAASSSRGSCETVIRTSAWDSDIEAETDPPDWTSTVSQEILSTLTTKQKKRQEVINELFHTERSHVRSLKVLDQLFYQPMKENQILPPDKVQLLFPNLEEMLEIHSQFNNNMKQRKKENPVVKEVGDILLNMFDGSEGKVFEEAAATFCSRQQIALEALKERRKKDPKLNNFLCEAEGNPICRRLQLKDIIPTGMLRLTKYPLLFESLSKYTERNTQEEQFIRRALERSKEILNHVNESVKEAEDQHRLADIQRRLDKSPFDKTDHSIAKEFNNFDLTKHKLIHEGPLLWRITNRPKLIELHVLLLEDLIILLQKQDEKFVLKFYNMNNAAGEKTPLLSPIIKISTALVRVNAVDKKALYLVNTSHSAQIYDLIASSPSEKKIWFRHISEVAEVYKSKEGKHKRVEIPLTATSHENNEKENNEINEKRQQIANGPQVPPDNTQADTHKTSSLSNKNKENQVVLDSSPRLTTTENSLIEPSQVLVSERSVLTAEPVLTPLERLRRSDETIREVLLQKQQLVADILHISQEERPTTNDSEITTGKTPSELLLAAINQANELTYAMNDSLRVTEEDAVIATSDSHGSTTACRMPSVPVFKLQSITSCLMTNLTQLVGILAQRDEERDTLRLELQRSKEQLHSLYEAQQRVQLNVTTPPPEEIALNGSQEETTDNK